MEKIKVLGFNITYDGDDSTGIFSEKWHLQGQLSFDDHEDYLAFTDSLKSAFEYANYDYVKADPIGFMIECPYCEAHVQVEDLPDDYMRCKECKNSFK